MNDAQDSHIFKFAAVSSSTKRSPLLALRYVRSYHSQSGARFKKIDLEIFE